MVLEPCLGRCDRAPAAHADDRRRGARTSASLAPVDAAASLPSRDRRAPSRGAPIPVTPLPQAGRRIAAACSVRARQPSIRRASTTTARPGGCYGAAPRRRDGRAQGVIRELKDSKLQGRGGAAFPTGVKWEAVARQPVRRTTSSATPTSPEPGTFKDRVIDGARPVRADRGDDDRRLRDGLRARLRLHPRRVPGAAARARARRSPRRGAAATSATTCSARASASTSRSARAPARTSAARRRRSSSRSRATAASRATSRPSRSSSGLFGKPTVVNNVETLVNVLDIVLALGPGVRRDGHRGLDRHEALLPLGPRRAPGRLRGAVRDDAARAARRWPAASPAARALQAVLMGGAAGGFLRPDELDLPLTFEGAREAKTTLGSGVVLVLDDTRRRAAPAACASPRSSATSRAASACPCRVGTVRQQEALARLVSGEHARRRRAASSRVIAEVGPVHARRVDLRARPDGVERDRVGDRAPRSLLGGAHERVLLAPRRMIELEIDGQPVRVFEGETILDALPPRSGSTTPTLCYGDTLEPGERLPRVRRRGRRARACSRPPARGRPRTG